jgi:hypothetical protein
MKLTSRMNSFDEDVRIGGRVAARSSAAGEKFCSGEE